MDNRFPLKGVRVIALTNFVAATATTRMMAEWGADVITVESFSKDPWRLYGPACKCPATPEENPLFDMYNAHKRAIALDLRGAQGKEIFFRLLKDADVFVTNTRQKALVKMGIDYDSIKDRFPGLVYGHITGYGQTGPEKDSPGFDGIAFFARSGLLADTADPSGYPSMAPGCGGDVPTGVALFGGICAALVGKQNTGKGDYVEVSLLGNAVWSCSTLATVTQPQYNDAYPKSRLELKPLNICYKCKDGEWLSISILQPEKYYEKFLTVLGIPRYIDDERFHTRQSILDHRSEIIPILEDAFIKFESSDLLKKLEAIDVVVTRMGHYKDLHTDPQVLENDFMRPFTFESGQTTVMPMTPLKSRNVGKVDFVRGPLYGEHTREVLAEAGYTEEEIGKFYETRVVE